MLAVQSGSSSARCSKGARGGWRRGRTPCVNGHYGLQALEPGWVTNRQIEAARVALTRHIKRGGKVWIRIFPDKPITKKPAETRMGKGKGSPEGWVAVVKPGRVMFELEGVTQEIAVKAMALAAAKISVKSQVHRARGGAHRMPKGLTATEIREWTRWRHPGARRRSSRRSGSGSRFRAATEDARGCACACAGCAATSRGSRPCCVNVNGATQAPRGEDT